MTTASLLFNTLKSDICFIVSKDKIKVPAHHFVLAKKSEFFKNNFNSRIEITEFVTTKLIEMVNIKIENIEEFLCYMYTDDFELTHQNVGQLHSLSTLFQVEDLLKMCSRYLCDETTLIQACSLPEFSYKVASHILRYPFPDKELELLAVNLNKRHIELILTSSFSHTDERKLFDFCMEWARLECHRKEIEPNTKNQRQQFDDLFTEIRFKSMNINDLKQIIEQNVGLFKPDELIELLLRKDSISWSFRLDPRLTVNNNFFQFHQTINKYNTNEKRFEFVFSSDRNIMLTSIEVLISSGDIKKKTDFYTVDVMDTLSHVPIVSKSHLLSKNKTNSVLKEFDWPGVLIKGNNLYFLCVTFNDSNIGMASPILHKTIVQHQGVCFTAHSGMCPFGDIGFSVI